MTEDFTSAELAFAMRRHFKCWMVESSGTVGSILARDPHYERIGFRTVGRVGDRGGGNRLPIYRMRRGD
jgi:hypothetical protein